MPAFVVGAGDRTAGGTRYCQRGDRHRVTPGHSPGPATVCVAQAEPTAPATCQTIEIPRTTPKVREGRGIYPAIPVIALGKFVLGEAQRALGDHGHALSSLEAAWTAGERGPDIDAALGYELGARATRASSMRSSGLSEDDLKDRDRLERLEAKGVALTAQRASS